MITGELFELGPYVVRQRSEPDRQWPLYCIYLGRVLIGKSFSKPDLGCCEWLERQMRDQTFYAYSTEKLTDKPYGFTATHQQYISKNRKRGAPQKPETIADIEKALAGG